MVNIEGYMYTLSYKIMSILDYNKIFPIGRWFKQRYKKETAQAQSIYDDEPRSNKPYKEW